MEAAGLELVTPAQLQQRLTESVLIREDDTLDNASPEEPELMKSATNNAPPPIMISTNVVLSDTQLDGSLVTLRCDVLCMSMTCERCKNRFTERQ